jgi:hypothetical protein
MEFALVEPVIEAFIPKKLKWRFKLTGTNIIWNKNLTNGS